MRVRKQLTRRKSLGPLVEAEKLLYAQRKTCYKKLIKRSKFKSWTDFVDNYGVDNPWGLEHKAAEIGLLWLAKETR